MAENGGHEIYNFRRPSLGHNYYKFSLSDLRPRELHKFYTFYPFIVPYFFQ